MNKQSTTYIHDTRHYINLDIFEKRPHSLKKICTILKFSEFCVFVKESSPMIANVHL